MSGAWDDTRPVHECSCCRYPFQGERCPNPGCELNLSDAAKAERAERKRIDDEWTANFRRFYHRHWTTRPRLGHQGQREANALPGLFERMVRLARVRY